MAARISPRWLSRFLPGIAGIERGGAQGGSSHKLDVHQLDDNQRQASVRTRPSHLIRLPMRAHRACPISHAK